MSLALHKALEASGRKANWGFVSQTSPVYFWTWPLFKTLDCGSGKSLRSEKWMQCSLKRLSRLVARAGVLPNRDCGSFFVGRLLLLSLSRAPPWLCRYRACQGLGRAGLFEIADRRRLTRHAMTEAQHKSLLSGGETQEDQHSQESQGDAGEQSSFLPPEKEDEALLSAEEGAALASANIDSITTDPDGKDAKETGDDACEEEYQACLGRLLRHRPMKLGLDDLRQVAQCLGNPQDKFQAVHVAGIKRTSFLPRNAEPNTPSQPCPPRTCKCFRNERQGKHLCEDSRMRPSQGSVSRHPVETERTFSLYSWLLCEGHA